MPIKGLNNFKPRLATIGKLRKGGAKTDPRRPGPDLHCWRFTSEDTKIVQAFTDAYGPSPVSVPVYLAYPTLDENFTAWKEAWTAAGLSHRCDGETCTRWLQKDGTYSTEAKPCPGGCKEVGRLTVLIPGLITAGIGGCVTIETHSINDILRIGGALTEALEARTGNPMGLRGVQFIARRVKARIGDGKGGKRDGWLISLERIDDGMIVQAAQGRAVNVKTGEIIEATVDEADDYEDDDSFPDESGGPDDMGNEPPVVVDVIRAKPAPKPEPIKVQAKQEPGKYPPRPWAPEVLRIALAEKSEAVEVKDPNESIQRAKVDLAQVFGKDDAARHDFLNFIYGIKSTNALTPGQAEALVRWAGVKKVGNDWLASAPSIEEAKAVLEAARANGQLIPQAVQDPAF